MIHWANVLMAEGKDNIVKEKMYDVTKPESSPILMDLAYLRDHWKDPAFDIWEESKGIHFATLMVQRRALLEGAQLARQLNDVTHD